MPGNPRILLWQHGTAVLLSLLKNYHVEKTDSRRCGGARGGGGPPRMESNVRKRLHSRCCLAQREIFKTQSVLKIGTFFSSPANYGVRFKMPELTAVRGTESGVGRTQGQRRTDPPLALLIFLAIARCIPLCSQ